MTHVDPARRVPPGLPPLRRAAARALAVAATAVLAAIAAAPAIAQPLTLDRALDLAERHSRQIPAHEAAAAAARERAHAALQRPDPVFKAAIENLPIDGPARFSLSRDFMTMRSVGAMQQLTRGDKRRARSARFEREADVAEAERAVARLELRRETVLAWLARLHAERVVALLRAQRDEAALQVDGADAAYRGGRGSQADIFAARSAVGRVDDRIRQARADVEIATTRLVRWVGAPGADALGGAPDLSTVRAAAADLAPWIEHDPRIALLARQEAAAVADAEVARTERRGDWTVEAMLSLRGSRYSNMATVAVSVPLTWDRENRQDREVAARLAEAERARALRDEATRDHLAQTAEWLQLWTIQRDRIADHGATLIPLAEQRTQAALAAYRGGSGPLAAVLASRHDEIEARLERLRIENDAAALWARIETLLEEHAATRPGPLPALPAAVVPAARPAAASAPNRRGDAAGTEIPR